ncbi:unnamed protein product [Symbiodinium sp. CCMP2592]|nr:unnamed protein product [Symbiodinium sp. CCMP2592]
MVKVLSHFAGELADLVVADGAPDATGRSDFDEYVQHQLLISELLLAESLLRQGGVFVAKVFRGEHSGELYARLNRDFEEVLCCKPRASRNSSQESFVVCRGFLANLEEGDTAYAPERHEALADLGPGAPSQVAAFVACGGSDSLDADTNYPVANDHRVLEPPAPPIAAPYKAALEERRRGTKRCARDGAEGEGAASAGTGD